MRNDHRISRRAILAAAGALPLLLSTIGRGHAEALPLVNVTKDPSCGCCDGWVAHIEAAGFPVRVVESTDMDSLKQRLGVPAELASCHTAEVGGYVVEGHVPAAAIRRLLAERPDATGLAVPGMPAGSPGMDFPGVDPEPYEVFLFGPTIQPFGRFLGAQEIWVRRLHMTGHLANDPKQHLAEAACLRQRGGLAVSGGARRERDIARASRATGKEGGA